MADYIGYIRVSTVKQGTQGVSLQEQKEAILRYANRHALTISLWLEELETAGKCGRSVFSQAVKLLRNRRYRGMILHKLDRGARNLKDWVLIGELSDLGADIHFAHESLDLNSRSGRLSADIQAVVAADYIRNLRDETRKGFYGRLKQGLYPLQAPLGYLNHGKGKPKTIDPVSGPIVRKAFELYSTGRYSLPTLKTEVDRLGLRNRRGGRISINGISTMLNNTFYIGIIRIEKTNEVFAGVHTPLLQKSLFEQVQNVLHTKVNTKTRRHAFQFRRLLVCGRCQYSLIGERQKGRIYYRCHERECPSNSIREDQVERALAEFLTRLAFNAEEKQLLTEKLAKVHEVSDRMREEELRSGKLRLEQLGARLNRLTDAYLDRVLEKDLFENRKRQLDLEKVNLQTDIARLESEETAKASYIKKFLELAGNAQLSYELATPEEKRELLQILTSNCLVAGKCVVVEPSLPFREIAKRAESSSCDPKRDTSRMCDSIIEHLSKLSSQNQLPDLSSLSGFRPVDKPDTREAG